MYNVNIDTAIAYQKNTITHHFLDEYDSKVTFHHHEQFERTKMIYGEEKMEKIYNSAIAVFGVGGVGGYVVEALARSGVSTFYLYDPDVVSVSNINRQIIATFKSINQDKVYALKQRILSINPDANVHTYKMFVDKDTIKDIDFSKFTYCVDALDTITTKILLIEKAKNENIPLISSMGTGNHLDPSSFKITDLAKTTHDPIAKVLRKELKSKNIIHQKVACSIEEPLTHVLDENGKRIPASNAFVPASVGLLIASEVIKDITE